MSHTDAGVVTYGMSYFPMTCSMYAPVEARDIPININRALRHIVPRGRWKRKAGVEDVSIE